MEYISKEQVFKQYQELLPWEKWEILDQILSDLGENTSIDYLFKQGMYSPFDYIDAKECVEHYDADRLMDEMYDSDIENYIESHSTSISSYSLIEALKNRWIYGKTTYVSDTNLKKLEELIEEIKEYKIQLNK